MQIHRFVPTRTIPTTPPYRQWTATSWGSPSTTSTKGTRPTSGSRPGPTRYGAASPDRDALSGRRSFSHFPAAGSGTARNQYRKAASVPVRAASRIPSPSYHSCRRTNSFRRLPPLLPPATAHVSMYGPIRRTVSTTALVPISAPQRRNHAHRRNRLSRNRQIPRHTCRFEKKSYICEPYCETGLNEIKTTE